MFEMPLLDGAYERVLARAAAHRRRARATAAVALMALALIVGASVTNFEPSAKTVQAAAAPVSMFNPIAAHQMKAAYTAAGLTPDVIRRVSTQMVVFPAVSSATLAMLGFAVLMFAGFSLVVVAMDPARAGPRARAHVGR